MKSRQPFVYAFLMVIALLGVLLPDGAPSSAAQSQMKPPVVPYVSDPTDKTANSAPRAARTVGAENVELVGRADTGVGLRVVDVSEPVNPTELGFYFTPYTASDVSVASAAHQVDGATQPDEAGEASFGWQIVGQVGGATQAVAVQGDYAYVGVGARLEVLQVSDTKSFHVVGNTSPFPYYVEEVVISGTLAYVAAGGAGLRVVDVSDPAHPTEVGAWDSLGYAEGVAVAGGTLYLADGPYGLRTVDVSDPTHPTEVGYVCDMNYAFDVVVGGEYAYIAAGGAGLLVADVSDPANPAEVAVLDTPGYAYGVAIANDAAFIADGWEGLYIVSVADPANPLYVSTHKTPGWALDVAVADDLAYVADAFRGLQVADVSDPVRPERAGGEDVWGGLASHVAVAGSIAYVADYYRGLRAIDVSDPTHPTLAGSFVPIGYADGVIVAGDYAYVAAGGYGLQVVDVADPAHPRELGGYDTQSYATSVAVDGNYAHVVSYATAFGRVAGLHIVDVSDPAHLTRVSYVEGQDSHRDIAVVNGIAYIADEWGLKTIDVSDPFHPAILGFIETWEGSDNPPDVTIGVVVSGTLAYMAATADHLEIVDVSNPTSPTLIGAFDFGGPACYDVAVVGTRVYLACGEFHVVDISDAAHPVELGSLVMPSDLTGVVVSGSIAYVAAGDAGVAAVDVSDPYSPTLVGSFNTPGLARQVDVAGDYVYVADGINGLLVLEAISGGPTGSSGTWLAKSQGMGGSQVASHQAVARSRNAPSRWPWQPPEPPDREKAPLASVPTETSRPIAPTAPERLRIVGTCVVTSTADSGAGTLRWCLENAESGTTITFEPSVFPPTSPVSITLQSPLPTILQGDITIDGSDAGVILDGSSQPEGDGLEIMSDGNVVQGLQILNFPAHGVSIAYCKHNIIGGDRAQGSGPVGQGNLISGNGFEFGGMGVAVGGSGAMSNTIIGNLIGTDASGMNALGNAGSGVFLSDGASNNRIGGTKPGERNVISGNGGGVYMMREAYGNTVIGNLIGTDASGVNVLGNQGDGIYLGDGASNNQIGGMGSGERNIISGNHGSGVNAAYGTVHSNHIVGNYVGTDISGTTALGAGGIAAGGFNNRIEGNLVSGNPDQEVSVGEYGGCCNVVVGNLIGTDASGTRAITSGTEGTGISSGGAYNRVGGTTPAERNVISGKEIGIDVSAAGSVGMLVIGNLIGTNITGTGSIGNAWTGVQLAYGSRAVVGGATPAERNVISGSGRQGIEVASEYNFVLGNYIGTDVSGSAALGNQGTGIRVVTWLGGAEHNIIQGNRIAHTGFSFSGQEHDGVGVLIDSYPHNTLRRNAIYGNAGKGIETVNGGNDMLAAPVITAAAETGVSGTACRGCTVEIFSDQEDEGQVYEGTAISDGNGNWSWTESLNGPYVTATATDKAGNTSAFSAPRVVWQHRAYLPLVLRR